MSTRRLRAGPGGLVWRVASLLIGGLCLLLLLLLQWLLLQIRVCTGLREIHIAIANRRWSSVRLSTGGCDAVPPQQCGLRLRGIRLHGLLLRLLWELLRLRLTQIISSRWRLVELLLLYVLSHRVGPAHLWFWWRRLRLLLLLLLLLGQ